MGNSLSHFSKTSIIR